MPQGVYPHLSPFWSPEQLGHPAVSESYTSHIKRIYTDYPIASPHTIPLCWSIGYRIHHQQGISLDAKLNPNPAESPRQLLIHLLRFLRADVGRMGIKLLQHSLYSLLHQLPLIHRIYVVM